MKNTNTKRALLTSILSVMLCMAMLVGSTFAWFTDSVTSGKNKIQAGNLDVELLMKTSADGDYENITGESAPIFGSGSIAQNNNAETLWEPGKTQVAYLAIKNNGSLALKYKVNLDVQNISKDIYKVMQYDIIPDAQYGTVTSWAGNGKNVVLGTQLVSGSDDVFLGVGETHYFALSIHMDENAGNEYMNGEVNFDLTVLATQTPYENDDFDDQYDKDAPVVSYEVTVDNIMEYLNGEHGSLSNAKLILAPGNYGKLEIGTPTKFIGSDTVYTCLNGTDHSDTPISFTDVDEFKAHMSTGWHFVPRYTRTIDNLTIVGQEGVIIEGVSISSGHIHRGDGPQITDPVLEQACDSYYFTQKLSNITFTNISFTDKVNINTSNSDTVIDGVTFDGCSFTTNGISSSNGQGLRYYNENNNGNMRNLTVKDCLFNNCYQGVYTVNISGVTVSGCNFDTTGHNAIAIQSSVHGPVNHKAVVIENNNFNEISDRIIRFGEVNAGTQITIKNNTATASGDSDGEIIKAQGLAQGVTFDIGNNAWGEGTKVASPEFEDQ